jgi:hypothetical protein
MIYIRQLFRKHKFITIVAALIVVIALGSSGYVLAHLGSGNAVPSSSSTVKATPVVQAVAGSTDVSNGLATAKVIPFQQGAPSPATPVGQIPAGFKDGDGTLISGTTAATAQAAAAAAFPGGTINRVSVLSDGTYNVHVIGVNWPHHVFVNQDFKVVGAE